MKKTSKIFMGVTAVVIAFSACAFTACSSSSEPNGTIAGNYQQATAEQVNYALNSVKQDTLLGDSTAKDFKFGIKLSSSLNATISTATQTDSYRLNGGCEILTTKNESGLTYKGEGGLNIYEESTPVKGEKSTKQTSLNLWQDDAMTYANVDIKSSEDKVGEEPKSRKIKLNCIQLLSSLIPSGDSDSTSFPLPEDIVIPDSSTTTGLSASDLVSAVNMLNEMGATVAMDTTDGIKLKLSVDEQAMYNLMAELLNSTYEQVTPLISFTKCSLDCYLSIDKNGLLDETSLVADLEATSNPLSSAETAITVKLDGYLHFTVNANVNPKVPESLKTDLTYIDVTTILPVMIGGIIGSDDLLG